MVTHSNSFALPCELQKWLWIISNIWSSVYDFGKKLMYSNSKQTLIDRKIYVEVTKTEIYIFKLVAFIVFENLCSVAVDDDVGGVLSLFLWKHLHWFVDGNGVYAKYFVIFLVCFNIPFEFPYKIHYSYFRCLTEHPSQFFRLTLLCTIDENLS